RSGNAAVARIYGIVDRERVRGSRWIEVGKIRIDSRIQEDPLAVLHAFEYSSLACRVVICANRIIGFPSPEVIAGGVHNRLPVRTRALPDGRIVDKRKTEV